MLTRRQYISSHLPLTAACERGVVTSDIQTQSRTPWGPPPPRRLWPVLLKDGRRGRGPIGRLDRCGWWRTCRTRGSFLFEQGHGCCRPVDLNIKDNSELARCTVFNKSAPASRCHTQQTIALSCLYAIQSCTARRITQLVAALAKLLGDWVGALVALWRQADKPRAGIVQLTRALSVHQFLASNKVWRGCPANQTWWECMHIHRNMVAYVKQGN